MGGVLQNIKFQAQGLRVLAGRCQEKNKEAEACRRSLYAGEERVFEVE
jgi:hypothetical protein